MNTQSFNSRLAFNLIIVCLIALIIFVAKSVLVPLGFAVMFAMLLLPVVKWLVKKGIPNVVAIILAILIALLCVAGILYFFSAQIAVFMEDLPAI
jgi:predicted PurR-regulated permease PerM